MDYIGATPQANPLLGLLAERLKQAQQFAAKPFGYSNPPAEMLMNLLGVPAVQQTAERLAYGEPLTTGRGMTTQIRPEAVEAALTVAPVAGLLGKGAETAAMAAGRAGERYAEKVVPQIMERGGLPAQLLGDLAQGSRRQIFVPASQEEAFQAAKLLRKKTPEEVWKKTGVAKFGDDFVKEISDKESSFNTVADIHESAEKIRQRNAELKQILNESKSTYPDLFPKELTAARKPLREEIKANQGLLEMPRGYVSDSSFSGNMAAIAYEHPELYKQVPEMKGVVIRQGRDLGDFLGAYENSPSRPLGSIDITKLGLKNDPRSTATHEMQHAVQEFYGLPGGGTPEEFMREAIADRNLLNSKIDDLNKKMREVSGTPEYDKIMEQRMALTQEYLDKGYGDMASVYKNASDQYQRLAGEAQSRLAQTRIDLTPEERRKYFPFAYGKENYGLDVNPEELIFRQGGLLGQSKAAESAPVQVYHGSKSKTITELDPSRSFGDLGVSWVTPEEKFAQRYAGKEGKVYKMDLSEGKNFDFSSKEDIAKLKDAAKKVEYYDPVRGFMTLDKRVPDAGDWKNAEDPRLFNLIKDMGYDSVSVYEDGVRNIGVFNPKKSIKFKQEKTNLLD